MEWTTHQNPKGFSLEHPIGWTVKSLPVAGVVISSPDGKCMSIIEPMQGVGAMSGADIIQKGLFHAASFFPGAKPVSVGPGMGTSTIGRLSYQIPGGIVGRAQLSYMAQGDFGMMYASAAPENEFSQMEPILVRILSSLKQNASANSAPDRAQSRADSVPSPGISGGGQGRGQSVKPLASPLPNPPPGIPGEGVTRLNARSDSVPPAAAPVSAVQYVKFTDPQSGAFTINVPQGWQIRGGLAHPMPGDRRPWIEAASPDGIYILCDPAFTQSFCHVPGQPEGQLIALAGGSMFNLKPSAERAADCYLKNVAARRFQSARQIGRRPRPDLVKLVNDGVRKLGFTIPKSAQTTAIAVSLQLMQAGQPRVASVYSMAFFNGDYPMGMWAFWSATIYLTIAPPALAQKAEQIFIHMTSSYQNTPQMMNIVQRDESIIYANGQAANAAQWNWFTGQQAAHNAQTAMGDAIVNNYWQQQAANDAMIRGWDQNQAVYDRLSQDRSDAMLGNQRLADDALGKQYDVPAGSNFYWLNQQTGQVIGTETSTPPDYSNNYTQLRKL